MMTASEASADSSSRSSSKKPKCNVHISSIFGFLIPLPFFMIVYENFVFLGYLMFLDPFLYIKGIPVENHYMKIIDESLIKCMNVTSRGYKESNFRVCITLLPNK